MSDAVNLEWIGTTLRSIQAEQRTLRMENELIRKELIEVLRVLVDRIANFEALMETRLDSLAAQIADRRDG